MIFMRFTWLKRTENPKQTIQVSTTESESVALTNTHFAVKIDFEMNFKIKEANVKKNRFTVIYTNECCILP